MRNLIFLTMTSVLLSGCGYRIYREAEVENKYDLGYTKGYVEATWEFLERDRENRKSREAQNGKD